VRDLTAHWREDAAGGVSFKIGMLPTQIGPMCERLWAMVEGKAALTLAARVPAGLIYGHLADGGDPPRRLALLEQIADQVRAGGGHLILTEASPEDKRRFPIWGQPGDTFKLMQRIKREFDPRGILSPGRFVGGL
jgi:glycolate oxidase FAD binding subunit